MYNGKKISSCRRSFILNHSHHFPPLGCNYYDHLIDIIGAHEMLTAPLVYLSVHMAGPKKLIGQIALYALITLISLVLPFNNFIHLSKLVGITNDKWGLGDFFVQEMLFVFIGQIVSFLLLRSSGIRILAAIVALADVIFALYFFTH